MSLVLLSTVWRKAHAAQKFEDEARARLREEPHRIPEMPVPEYEDMFNAFRRAHQTQVIPDNNCPTAVGWIG